MAEDVIDQPAERQPEAELVRVPDRRERARASSYRFRFGVLYVLLAGIVGAGIGVAVILALRPAPPEAAAWSAWEPEGSKLAMVRQIADRIPKAYKQPNGNPLTVTEANQLAVQTQEGPVPISSIFVYPDTSRGLAEESDIERYDGADAVSYGLCGVGSGKQCAVPADTQTSNRLTLLRRQALELSLYTFKYVEGVESVIVYLPPTPKGESRGSVFLRRNEVADELRRPIGELLPSVTPRAGELGELELGNILRLTLPRTYEFEFQPAPDGRPWLVLTPPAAGSGS